jgi:TonB family protein
LDSDEQVFFIVEEMPEFPGGELALRKYIANTIKYPEVAQTNGIQGKVYVTFVVSKDGAVANAKIARGVDPSLDREALRVVNSLPKWKAGKQRGETVNVSYTVPINFVLQ